MTNVYFYGKYGQIAQVFAGSSEEVIPAFINDFMPEWFAAIFMIVAISAGMSTISSQFHTMGTAVAKDLFINKNRDEKGTMRITRVGLIIAIVVTIFLAYLLPKVWNGAIVISTGLFFGICAASFLPLYIGALYFKKMTRKAAISGMLAGFSTSMLWMLFVHGIGSTEAVQAEWVALGQGQTRLRDRWSFLAVSCGFWWVVLKTHLGPEKIRTVFSGERSKMR